MRWIIVSEREFSLSFSKINKPSNSKSVTCFFLLRSLENSTILNKNNKRLKLLKTSEIFIKVTNQLTQLSRCIFL